ncbi:transcription antitermination factor NusB [Pueribacillus theae]|uniref:Transcription antitermination protein NusB n=1 Tax=Pueribacillus theae TaxID=2171751 RepID=A0A2U1K832_9BACI|nr:transcription antitermination factor NusB [Pueribacillus theae]PWA13213.1 transcription antitermination factor NusB [Pueribacillus theae]
MKRRQAREKAVQALFQMHLNETDINETMDYVLNDEETDPFFERLVEGTIANLDSIDSTIKKHLENWRFDRIANVDRAILRLAVYELKYEEDIPSNVTLNEAVELAKTFGSEESKRFINGVLSKILGGEQ